MTKYILIALALSLAANAGMAWWGIHEHTAAATARSDAQASLSAAQTQAEVKARAEQQAADAATLDAAQKLADRATDAATSAQMQVSTSETQATDTVRQLHKVQHHAKPTDCINRPLPAGVRSVLDGADSTQR